MGEGKRLETLSYEPLRDGNLKRYGSLTCGRYTVKHKSQGTVMVKGKNKNRPKFLVRKNLHSFHTIFIRI